MLCGDEKSQIQALDRTQPGLPMKAGRRGTMTHDYKRRREVRSPAMEHHFFLGPGPFASSLTRVWIY